MKTAKSKRASNFQEVSMPSIWSKSQFVEQILLYTLR
jgi:hypothetical protein